MPVTVCKECHEVLDSSPDVDGVRVDATCDECAELLRLRARVAELEEEATRLRAVAVAAEAWITHLENKGGHFYDGVPGDIMDALDGLGILKEGE